MLVYVFLSPKCIKKTNCKLPFDFPKLTQKHIKRLKKNKNLLNHFTFSQIKKLSSQAFFLYFEYYLLKLLECKF